MLIRKDYLLEIRNSAYPILVASFDFKNLSEVKQFMKHLGENAMVSDGSYTVKLYERTMTWDLSEGTTYSMLNQVTEDF